MTRLDTDAALLRESPAIALEWSEVLVRKLDRAIKARKPTEIKLTSDEVQVLIDHAGGLDPDYHTNWISHRGQMVVFRGGDKPTVWHL